MRLLTVLQLEKDAEKAGWHSVLVGFSVAVISTMTRAAFRNVYLGLQFWGLESILVWQTAGRQAGMVVELDAESSHPELQAQSSRENE